MEIVVAIFGMLIVLSISNVANILTKINNKLGDKND